MDLKNTYWMESLMASCPHCRRSTLFSATIFLKIKDRKNTEILFCKTCEFVVPTKDYKKLLFCE